MNLKLASFWSSVKRKNICYAVKKFVNCITKMRCKKVGTLKWQNIRVRFGARVDMYGSIFYKSVNQPEHEML